MMIDYKKKKKSDSRAVLHFIPIEEFSKFPPWHFQK